MSSEFLSIIFGLLISFNAKYLSVNIFLTFHTFPKPPLPITYKNSKSSFVTIFIKNINNNKIILLVYFYLLTFFLKTFFDK